MKKIFSIFLALLLLTFQTPQFVLANDALLTWQDDGIPKEPIYNELTGEFEIYTPNQLAWIAYKTNSTTESSDLNGWSFSIMNDIDLSGREWIPIKNFSGTINGNNRTLRNLYLNSDENYSGLFASLSSATVSDLTLSDVSIISDSLYVGSLSGYANSSLISNVKSDGSVSGNSYTGGLVGKCNATNITLSSFNGNVVGIDKVGGLVGCYEDTYCRYLVTYMKQCFSSGKVNGNQYVGGLVGSKYYTGIQDCYSLSDVSGNSVIGGLVGIVVNTNNNYQIVVSISSIMTQNTYSFGNVSGNSYVGGVFGGGVDGLGLNYWNINSTHKVANVELDMFSKSGAGCYSTNDKKLTITQMKDKNNFSSFDFDDIWNIDPEMNNGLPYLRNYNYDDLEQSTDYTIKELYVSDIYGEKIGNGTTIPKINKFCVNVSITKNAATAEKGYLFIATYTDAGQLIDFNIMSGTYYQNQEITFISTINNPDGKIGKIKAFVWDSLTSLTPLSNSLCID